MHAQDVSRRVRTDRRGDDSLQDNSKVLEIAELFAFKGKTLKWIGLEIKGCMKGWARRSRNKSWIKKTFFTWHLADSKYPCIVFRVRTQTRVGCIPSWKSARHRYALVGTYAPYEHPYTFYTAIYVYVLCNICMRVYAYVYACLAPFWSWRIPMGSTRAWRICADRGNVTIPFGRIIEMTPLQSRDRDPPYLQWHESVRAFPFHPRPLAVGRGAGDLSSRTAQTR